MKKIALIILIFISVILLIFFVLKRSHRENRFSELKNYKKYTNDTLILQDTKPLSTDAIRLFFFDSSLYVVTSQGAYKLNSHLEIDKSLLGEHKGNSVWSIFRKGDTTYFLFYPSGILLKQFGTTNQEIKLPEVYHNGTLLGNNIVGFYTKKSIPHLQYFDLISHKVVTDIDLTNLFKNEKGFVNNECFAEAVEGNFATVDDTKIIFYCYFNSYFIELNKTGFPNLKQGIDSLSLPKAKMVTTEINKDVTISKCTLEDERYIVLYAYGSKQNYYSLSNIKVKSIGTKSIDVYDAIGFKYKYSIKIPARQNTEIDYFSVDNEGKTFYILYRDGNLSKFVLSKRN